MKHARQWPSMGEPFACGWHGHLARALVVALARRQWHPATHQSHPTHKVGIVGPLALAILVLAGVRSAISADAPASAGQSGRRPGVIVNQAADALVGYLRTEKPLEDGATKEMILAGLRQAVDQYVDTNVSDVFFNVCYQRAAYPSDLWETYWDVDNPERDVTGWPRRYWLIHRHGIDPFAVCIARSREKGLSPWVSLRMNDTHYIDDPSKTSRLWQEHPEFRTSDRRGFDYTRPEVQGRYLSLIEELLHRYDVDGAELDWMRFAHHFKPDDVERGRVILTDFMRKARQMADEAAGRCGHAVRLAVRVPATPEFAEGLGMDAVAWVREGLVDVLIPCSTWNPSYPDIPVERWRERIGPEAKGYVLAPGTDLWIRGAPGGRFMRTDMETMRAFTATMLDRGADQIYLFNHFVPVDFKLAYGGLDDAPGNRHVYGDLLREAGSLEKALAGPRRHVLTYHSPVPPGADYRKPLPAEIGPGQAARLRLSIGPKPAGGRVTVRVGLDESPGYGDAKLAVRLNGAACRPGKDLPRLKPSEPPPKRGSYEVWSVGDVAPRVIPFEAPLASVERGYNTVEIEAARDGAQRVVWLEIHLDPAPAPESARPSSE